MGERSLVVCLEALPVDNGGAGLIVLLLADPHLLEGGQGSQDGATDPDGVLPLGRSNDLKEGGEEERDEYSASALRFLCNYVF